MISEYERLARLFKRLIADEMSRVSCADCVVSLKLACRFWSLQDSYRVSVLLLAAQKGIHVCARTEERKTD